MGDAQGAARGQLEHSAEHGQGRGRGGGGHEGQGVAEGGRVGLAGHVRAGQQGLDLRGEARGPGQETEIDRAASRPRDRAPGSGCCRGRRARPGRTCRSGAATGPAPTVRSRAPGTSGCRRGPWRSGWPRPSSSARRAAWLYISPLKTTRTAPSSPAMGWAAPAREIDDGQPPGGPGRSGRRGDVHRPWSSGPRWDHGVARMAARDARGPRAANPSAGRLLCRTWRGSDLLPRPRRP